MHTHKHLSTHARMEFASGLIKEAGSLALSHFRQLSTLVVENKSSGQDVVTIADRNVETLIRTRLVAKYPADAVLGEEFGHSEGTSGFTWTIDPIDGTSCFLHGLPTWCVAIALVHDGRTVGGLIHDPNAAELFSAIEGEGARLNGKPISIDGTTDLQHGLTSVGANLRAHPRAISGFIHHLLDAGGMFVRSGSGALSLAHVSCGRLAAYYEPHMNAWDCIAAQCIIREAGGWTNDYLGETGLTGTGPVMGCAPQIRDALLAIVAKAGSPDA